MSIPAVIMIAYISISIFGAVIMHGRTVKINAYQNVALIAFLAAICFLGGLFS